jgi:hypothetical protein
MVDIYVVDPIALVYVVGENARVDIHFDRALFAFLNFYRSMTCH